MGKRKILVYVLCLLAFLPATPAAADDMPAEEKRIYLTFDDGPGPYTAKLLDVLAEHDAHATFFLVNTGYHMDSLLERMVQEGHGVGIHSLNHDFKTLYSSEEAFWEDLLGMQELIREKTGVTTMLMRFPGGSSNTISRRSPGIMSRLTRQVTEAGFCYFDWNVDSGDAYGCCDEERIYQNIIAGIRGKTAAVVLQHDIHEHSVRVVERILRWGEANGYRFLPLTADSPCCHHRVQN